MTRTTPAGHTRFRPPSGAVLTAFALCAAFIMFCGAAGAADYGDIDVTPGNAIEWSTNLSNNLSTVSGNITVNSGANLNLSSATIVMSCSSLRSITVKDGAAMNLTGGSKINHTGASYYDWRYESGSTGYLIDSIIEGNASKVVKVGAGVRLNYTTNVVIDNSTFKNYERGIYLYHSEYNSITNSTVTNNTYGIWMEYSNSNNITGNSAANGSNGIYLKSSNNNTLQNNIANSNSNGIYLSSSRNNDLNNNTANSNSNGINLESSEDNTLGGNQMNTSTAYGLYVTGKYNNPIDPLSNTVNGEPVYYYYDHGGGTLNDTNITETKVCNLGRITLINSTGFTIHNVTIINNSAGIYLRGSGGSTVNDSTLRNTRFGIYISSGSSGSTADNNNISENNQQGIYIDQSDGAVITNNNFTGNAEGVRVDGGSNGITINSNTMQSNTEGIYVSGSNNTIASGNTITSGERGIYLANVINNTISNNTAASSNYGIYVIGSSCNNITYNNASNNSNYGIYITDSFSNNITGNNASNNSNAGIYLYESNNNNVSANTLRNNTDGIALEYYSKNNTIEYNYISDNTMGIELKDYSDSNTLYVNQNISDDIQVDRCGNTRIVPNASVTADIHLVDDIRVTLLDAVFNASSINVTGTAMLTVKWRVDVRVMAGYQYVKGANVSIYYNNSAVPVNGTTTERDGSLDNTELPEIIEYTWNASLKNTDYQPINVTAYETVFYNTSDFTPGTTINRTGITVVVTLQQYSPNGYCYYCHRDKMEFETSDHAVNNKTCGPTNCTDCHNKTDSEAVPHTFTSGPDLLISRSPQLCYYGSGNKTTCHRSPEEGGVNKTGFDQKNEFTNYTSHHPVDGVNMSCNSCHDNHGVSAEYAGPTNGSEQSPVWRETVDIDNYWTINKSYKIADHDLKRYFYTGDEILGKLEVILPPPEKYKGNYTASGALGGYNPEAFELCFTCHLEENLTNTTVQKTNFWEPNYSSSYADLQKFGANLHAFHLINKSDITSGCRNCHNPHGSPNPRMTRNESLYDPVNSTGGFFAFHNGTDAGDTAYNLTDPGDWDNATLNTGGYLTKKISEGGWGSPDVGDCSCHNIEPPIEPFNPNASNSYIRPLLNVTPTGGPNCSYCHNSEFAIPYRINSTVNYTAVKMGIHTDLNKECNNISKECNTTYWAGQRGFDASEISADNRICWGCHATNGTPPYPNYHPDRSLNPYKCAKCHGEYQPVHVNASFVNYSAGIVQSHGPTTGGANSTGVQTDIGKGGSCHDCHSPNRIVDIALTRGYAHTTVLGNVSHYGINKTEGESGKYNVIRPLFNTMECLWCHDNSTNASAWGNATLMFNTTPHIHNNVSWNNTVCLECHVESNRRGVVNFIPTNFHSSNETDKPLWNAGPDCVLCHSLGNPYNYTAVNTTAISHDIHANINQRIDQYPYSSVNPASKLCWVCHDSEGEEVISMGDRNTNPWKCRDCHTVSGERRYSTQHNTIMPYLVEEHQPDAVYVRTNRTGKPNGTCAFCHNNSIDLNHGDNSEGNIGNTLEAIVSHYGLDNTSNKLMATGSNSTDCIYCHNSTLNGLKWGSATQIELGVHAGGEANSNSDCWREDCHAVDNATLLKEGFHNGTMRFGGGPNCTKCHDMWGIATNVNITSIGGSMHGGIRNGTVFEYIESQPCWVCHGDGSEPANMTHPSRVKNPYKCEDCHANLTVNTYASKYGSPPLVHEHIPNGTNIQTNVWGAPNGTCVFCHNNSIDTYNNDTDTGKQLRNYLLANVSHYGLNKTHNMTMAAGINSTDCLYCHGNENNGARWGSATQATHGEVNNFKCWECHNKTGGGGMPSTFHAINQSYGDTSDCLSCHDISMPGNKSNYTWVNGTAVRESVHSSINNGTYDYINRTCWACHFTNGTVTSITDHTVRRGYRENLPPYNCWECHNATAKPYPNVSNAANVTEHFVNSTEVRAVRNAANETESCLACHNLTGMKVSGYNITNATYNLSSYVSHYARNYTELSSLRNLTNSTEYCSYCHNNASGVFAGFIDQPFINKSCQNITHGTNCTACHGEGRIHDENINKSRGDDCSGCHGDLGSSIAPGYYVNMTMFNESVHRIRPGFNCTDCHTMTGYSSRSYNHPSLEYGWKWCECCHSYQEDPLNMTDRHNITLDPFNYMLNATSVVNITECTFCHNATAYSNAVANYDNSTAANYTTNSCRYCHEYPDKGDKTSQSWY